MVIKKRLDIVQPFFVLVDSHGQARGTKTYTLSANTNALTHA